MAGMGLIRIAALCAAAFGYAAEAPGELTLKEMFQQAHIVVEGRPLPRFARPEAISFADSAAGIPTLARDSWRIVTAAVYKNVLGQDLPETLIVFAAGTRAAATAQRAAYGACEPDSAPMHFYKSPLPEAALGKDKNVIVFLDQVIDDTTVTPQVRFELTALGAYEKVANRANVIRYAPRNAYDPMHDPMR